MSPEPVSSADSSRAGGTHTPKPRETAGEPNTPKGQQGTRRFAFTSWPDEQDRDLCAHSLALQPERTPISARAGIAVAKWLVVDRREQRVLICNRIHDGACEWPWDIQAG